MADPFDENIILKTPQLNPKDPLRQPVVGGTSVYDNLLSAKPIDTAAPAVEAAKKTSVYDDLIKKAAKTQDDLINANIAEALKGDPNKAGEIQRLAQESGAPLDLTSRNAEEIKARLMEQRIRAFQMSNTSPVLARQLRDRAFADIAYDQIENLSATEKVFKFFRDIPNDASVGFQAGRLTTELGFLGQRAQSGVATPDDMARIVAINNQLKTLRGSQGMMESASKIVGQQADTLIPALTYGGATGLTAGGAGMLAGPGSPVSVPALAVGGLVAGTVAKMAEQSYRIEAGHSYLEMIEAGVDRNTAQYASTGVGLVNAGLEMVGVGLVAKPFKSALIRSVTEGVAESLKKPTMNVALRNFGVNYGLAVGGETVTELLQEGVSIAGTELAKLAGPNKLESLLATPEGRKQISDRLVGTFEEVVKGMALLGLPGAGFNFRYDYNRAKNAEQQQRFFETLNAQAADSEVRNRNPAQYERFIQAQAQGTVVENIYIDAQQMVNVLRQSGLSTEQLSRVLPEVAATLDEKAATGGDVVMTTAQYAARVAGTDLGKAMMEHVRVAEDGMSIAEAKAFAKDREQLAAEAKALVDEKASTDKAFAQGASQVRNEVLNQIKATGTYSAKAAQTYADMFRDFVVTQSVKLGMNPTEFYSKYMYKVQGASRTGMPAEMQLFDQAGSVQTKSNAFKGFYGRSVFKDQEGNPRVLYHGTIDSIDAFDLDHPNRKDSGWLGTGVYLTDSADLAEIYANQKARSFGPKGQNVMPLYAKVENPYYATMEEKAKIKAGGREAADAFTQSLIEQGYDGVILQLAPDAQEIVVFDPASVKSVFNGGTWSAEDTNLLAQRGKEQSVGRVVPDAVVDVANVESAFDFAGTQQFKTNREFKLAIQKRVLDAAKAAKVDLSDFTKNVERYLVKVAVADAFTALQTNPNAVGWYNEKVTKALRIVSLVHPEVATDAQAKFAFTWALAVTSNGMKVDKNFELAERAYRAFKETGRMPTDLGAGEAQIAINEGLDLYNRLVDRYGIERVIAFMTTKTTVKEVELFTGKNVSGENLTTEVYGAAALGPKIGNGFFANLYGHFEQLTMDRWLMRTWGRWTGTLVEENKANIKVKQQQLKQLIQAMSPADKKAFEAIIKTKLAVGKLDQVAVAINKASQKPANRVAMAQIGKVVDNNNALATFDEILGPAKKNVTRASFGDELRKVGNSLAGYLDGQKEQPSGPPERGRIRQVMAQVLSELQQTYPSLTMSDLQALLWYPEKRLYDSAKTAEEGATGYEDNEAPDYANAAAALAQAQGVPQEQINRTIQEVDNELAIQSAQRTAGVQRTDGDGLLRQGVRQAEDDRATVVFEVAPDPNDWRLADRWRSLTNSERLIASTQVAQEIVPAVLEAANASGAVVAQIGSYLNDTNPSFAIKLTSGNPIEVARGLGFALSQDSMMVVSPVAFEGGFQTGAIRINIGPKTEAEVDAIYQALRGIQGYPQIQGQTTTDGFMTIMLDAGVDPAGMANAIDQTLEGNYAVDFASIYAAFPEKQEYDYGSEGNDPAGSEGLARSGYRNARAQAAAALNRSLLEFERAGNERSRAERDSAELAADVRANDQRQEGGLTNEEGQLNQGGDGGRRYSGGGLAPLAGAPVVEGATGPDARLVSVAEKYARDNGISLARQANYVEVDTARAERIAQAYQAMEHAPNDPAVREAYQNLIDQTIAQYRALEEAGYKFYFFDETNDPYGGNPWNAMRDLRNNQTMGVFATEAGFGTGEFDVADNPLLQDTGITWPFGSLEGEQKRVLANDLFRAVHDAFGHGMEGSGFRDRGEENAWQAHVRLFTGSAVAAITSETRGQNSWLNYGPYGEKNRTAKVDETIFADQKTGLMPEWTWTEGRAADMPDLRQESARDARSKAILNQPARGGFDPRKLTTILNEQADYSTFLHETAHFFLTVYADMAQLPNATQQMRDDMQVVLDWFGVKDLATWNAMSLDEQRKYHETFAYNFEIYLFEGKAPSVKLQSMFDKFASWLRTVYKSIRDELNEIYKAENGTDLPLLTGEVRQVMDRMLASEEAIDQAQQVRAMMPMFQTQEQSGMDDATWAAYQDLVKEAQEAAVTDLSRASVRQMKWLSNARSRVIKELQKQAETQRKEVSAQVAEEVKQTPVYQAMEFLKRGTTVDAEGNEVQALEGHKISIDSVNAIYPESQAGLQKRPDIAKLGYGKYGMLAKEGLPVQLVAEMFGFRSGDNLIKALLDAKPLKEEIAAKTDERMLELYGDLQSPAAMELEVERALHNEARARFVAVELRFLAKFTAPVRVMTAAARQVANEIIGAQVIKNIQPRQYAAAEARASRQSQDLSKKGNAIEAARAKQNQLVQNQLATQAVAARNEVREAVVEFRKFFKADDRIAKTRNMDLVNAARSILAYYGLGKKDKPPVAYIDQLRAYNPDFYAEIEPIIIAASTGNKKYDELTVDQFRALRDTVEALWFQARRQNQIMIDGKLMDKEEVLSEMNARLDEIGVPAEVPGEKAAPSKKERMFRTLNFTKAMTRRIEHWADATDGVKGPGPFTKYVFRPVREAITQYRMERNKYVKQYVDLVSQLDLRVGKIDATELGYTFGAENGGIGKAEVLGAMLHTGNESNLRKLVLGRGWGGINADGTLDASRWSAFVQRMIDEGVLTKKDFDWLQSVWDLNEEMKPLAQKAHKDVFGYYFKEVPATPVQTPFGTYRGGYVPAKTDPFMVRDAQRNAKMEELESDFRNAMPSTGMGFTKGRVEYNKPLSLDVRLMTKHIDDVLRFAFVQPAIKDVLGLVRNREFADKLTRIDPNAIEDMLLPWLNRAARQTTVEPGMHRAVDQFWRTVRNRTGIGIMFANFTNALQQMTGYFPAMIKVKPTYLKQGLARYMASPSKTAEEIGELSPFMADRMNSQMFDIQENLNDLVLNPSRYDKMQSWAQKHGYFLQQAFQNQVDAVTWIGAYNQALAEMGKDVGDAAASKEAVARADAAVRTTQSSLAAEDISAFEVGTPFYKTLVQFQNYFNMLANLNAGEYIKIVRDLGWRGNKGKLLMTYILGFAAPMLVADAIVKTLGGQWDDDDDDGYLDEVADWFFLGQLRGMVAMVPFGTVALVPLNSLNDKPYDDRITTSPSISTLEAATVGTTKAVINIVSPDKDVTGKNVKDVLTLLSLVTGLPLTVLGRPIGYQVDVNRGKVEPTSDADYVRGLLTGKASEASR